MPQNLTFWQVVGPTIVAALLAAIGYLGRRLWLEKRRNRAIDKQEEQRARQLELSADGVEVENFGQLVEKAERVFNNTLQLQRQLLEAEKKLAEQDRRIGEQDKRIGELESEVRHLNATLKAEIQKTAAKEQELVEVRSKYHELEDRIKDAESAGG